MLRLLDLFSGIGGFSLGLEATGGFQTVAFCEIEPYCRRVLSKHWPEVPQYDDIRTLNAERLAADGIAMDAICGGFPCQDISYAGLGAGLAGERSGLWREYARLVGEIRPRYVFIENVSALLGRGLSDVLCDLAALGYDAEWHCIPASAVGAPHRRDRVWIVAYAKRERCGAGTALRCGPPDSNHEKRDSEKAAAGWNDIEPRAGWGGAALAYADCHDEHGWGRDVQVGRQCGEGAVAPNCLPGRNEWRSEPDVGRVAHGVPSRLDRLRGLGNAVVPQIPYLIGQALLNALAEGAHQS